jgi:hypothetical protein
MSMPGIPLCVDSAHHLAVAAHTRAQLLLCCPTLKACWLPRSASAEFWRITWKTALGFVVMGFIGFFVKLIFIVRAHSAHTCETAHMHRQNHNSRHNRPSAALAFLGHVHMPV